MPVYFIQAGADGAIKIGFARDVAARIRYLDVASSVPLVVLATIAGGCEIERRAHRRFQHLRIRGEWFRPAEELLEFCRAPNPDDLPPLPERTPHRMTPLKKLLRSFGGPITLAAELAIREPRYSLSPKGVEKWCERDAIPPRWHIHILALAQRLGLELSLEDLHRLSRSSSSAQAA